MMDPCVMNRQQAIDEYDRIMALPEYKWIKQEFRLEAVIDRLRTLSYEAMDAKGQVK